MNPPKMPIHIGDYHRDTGHLRATEHGAYLLLMFHYWSTGGLPDNDDHLATIARLSRGEWKKIKPTLQAFFKDGWKHGRIDYDLEKARNISDAAREAGKASGRSRSVKPPLNERSSTVQPTLLPSNHSKKDAADAASPKLSLVPEPPPMTRAELEKSYFDRGKQILGRNAGGMLTKLIAARGSLELARATIEISSDKQDPREYIGAVIRSRDPTNYVDPRL